MGNKKWDGMFTTVPVNPAPLRYFIAFISITLILDFNAMDRGTCASRADVDDLTNRSFSLARDHIQGNGRVLLEGRNHNRDTGPAM